MLGLLEFCCESTSFWWLQNLSIFREWDQQQPSMGLWLELWLCENQCWVHHLRDHGDFINSCTDVQEGERLWQKSQDFQTQTLNQTPSISSFESSYVFFNNLAISLYYLLFWIYQHSLRNLATTQKLFRNTSPHTFALWTPLKRPSPYKPHSTTQRIFCFVLFWQSDDGHWWWHFFSNHSSSHNSKSHSIQNQKRPRKMGVSYTTLVVLE